MIKRLFIAAQLDASTRTKRQQDCFWDFQGRDIDRCLKHGKCNKTAHHRVSMDTTQMLEELVIARIAVEIGLGRAVRDSRARSEICANLGMIYGMNPANAVYDIVTLARKYAARRSRVLLAGLDQFIRTDDLRLSGISTLLLFDELLRYLRLVLHCFDKPITP